jgi:hypothetical protein
VRVEVTGLDHTEVAMAEAHQTLLKRKALTLQLTQPTPDQFRLLC